MSCITQHAVRLNRPVNAYERWMQRIPDAYGEFVKGQKPLPPSSIEHDPDCLATLKHFRSLMPLAQEARKPMFALRPADGAIGGHANAVRACCRDFRSLARRIAQRCGVAET